MRATLLYSSLLLAVLLLAGENSSLNLDKHLGVGSDRQPLLSWLLQNSLQQSKSIFNSKGSTSAKRPST